MVATARRLAAMPISAIVVQRPTAAVLRSGNTAAREPSQRLDVVGRGSLTLGNQIAPVNRNFVTVQPPIIDAKKLRPRFESRTVKQRRPRRLRSPPLPPSDAMTGVPPKIGSERVGMMKSSRLAVVIASPIRGKSAMSLVSGKSVGMSVIRIVTGLSASVDGAAVIHVANAIGRPVENARRAASMRIGRSILGIRAAMTNGRYGGLFLQGGTGSSKSLASPTPVLGACDKLSGEVQPQVFSLTPPRFQCESGSQLSAQYLAQRYLAKDSDLSTSRVSVA